MATRSAPCANSSVSVAFASATISAVSLAVKGKALGRTPLRKIAGIVTPDTILRWYRTLVAQKYDGRRHCGPGRPRAAGAIVSVVVRIATENPTFGYTRIRDALSNLGHEVGRNTVKRILAMHGIEPAPERVKRTPWKTFLKAHWDAIAAADFFTVEVLTLGGLVRYHVFFVMALKTRRVEIAGITSQPCDAWMTQLARNLTDAVDGFLQGTRYLILDCDPLYTRGFRRMLKDSGVQVVRLPAKCPNLNANGRPRCRRVRRPTPDTRYDSAQQISASTWSIARPGELLEGTVS